MVGDNIVAEVEVVGARLQAQDGVMEEVDIVGVLIDSSIIDRAPPISSPSRRIDTPRTGESKENVSSSRRSKRRLYMAKSLYKVGIESQVWHS